MIEPSRVAIVVQTHFYDDLIHGVYQRLVAEAPDYCTVFLLINCGDNAAAHPSATASIGDRCYVCNTAMLLAMEYPEKCQPKGWSGNGWTLNPGNTDLLMLSFARSYPEYDYYWGVEYDVHYEGSWRTFFDHFASSRSDLLGTTLYRQDETPKKKLMPLQVDRSRTPVAPSDALRGFFPIFRISAKAVAAIETEYRAGWGGHYELTWPTIARNHGLLIEDIGGDGTFVAPENRNRFYYNFKSSWSMSPGTFVFRPTICNVSPRLNTLWHPVKPAGQYDNWQRTKFGGRFSKNIYETIKPFFWKLITEAWFLTKWNKLP